MKSHKPQPLPPAFTDYRDLLADCYNLASEVPNKIEVYNENPLQVITSCLFIKILNASRAELLLFDNNLLSETSVLLRYQMEAVFVLRACKEDETFLKEYIGSDTRYRLKLGNIIVTKREDFDKNDNFDIERILTVKAELQSLVDENGIKEIKIEELARKAKLESHYNTAYRVLSNIVHVGVKSLDDYLVLVDGKIKELSIYPYQEDIAMLFITAIELTLLAIESISHIFEINLSEELKSLDNRLSELAKPLRK